MMRRAIAPRSARGELDHGAVGCVLELEIAAMRERGRTEVREHDALRAELGAVLHELRIRDVRWILALVERRLADEQIGALRDRNEVLAPACVARVRDGGVR